MLILFFALVTNMIGFGIVIPLLPLFARSLHLEADQIGIIASSFSVFQLFSAVAIGYISDRFGRKTIIIVCTLLTTFTYLGTAFAHNFWELLIARSAAGLFSGYFAAVMAAGALKTPKEKRVKAMATLGIAFGLGFVIGPVLGGVIVGNSLNSSSFLLPNLIGTFLNLLSVLFLCFFKDAPVIREKSDQHPIKEVGTKFIELVKSKVIIEMLLVTLVFFACFAGFETFLVIWNLEKFNFGPEKNGFILLAFSLTNFLCQGLIIRRFNLSGKKPFVTGLLIIAIGFSLIPFAYSIPLLVGSVLVMAVGFSLVIPNMNNVISINSSDSNQGLVFGISQSFGTIGRLLGPLLLGYVYLYKPSLTWFSCAIILFLLFIITALTFTNEKKKPV